MNESLFPGLACLKQRLDTSRQADFFHEEGHIATLRFDWQSGASSDELLATEQALNIKFPQVYRRFLQETNGAVLFYDVQYGQWGYQLFGTDELARPVAGIWREFWGRRYLAA